MSISASSINENNTDPINPEFIKSQLERINFKSTEASNINQDAKKESLREKAAELLQSEIMNVGPKVLAVFGGWNILNGAMKIMEEGFGETLKKIIPATIILAGSLGFEKFKHKLIEFTSEKPVIPEVKLEEMQWTKDDLEIFIRMIRSWANSTSNYLGKSSDKEKLQGTSRAGLLILAGPPGNGKTALVNGLKPLLGKNLFKVNASKEMNDVKSIEASLKQGDILFVDEADQLVSGRNAEEFKALFNDYQSKGLMVVVTTNSNISPNNPLQTRACIINKNNPNTELKTKIFINYLKNHTGIKEETFNNLIKNEEGLKSLLDKHDLSIRALEGVIKDSIVIAEMRIEKAMLEKGLNNEQNSEAAINSLGQEEASLQLNDVQIALEDLEQRHKAAGNSKKVDLGNLFTE